METQELHRGRLIDHIQLVVRDLPASQKFYTAVFEVLGIPLGGKADDYFWADELFVSTADSQAAQGALTGRHHLAFQAKDRATVDAFYQTALPIKPGRCAAPDNEGVDQGDAACEDHCDGKNGRVICH